MRGRLLAGAAVGAALLLLGAACSDDGEETSAATTDPPTTTAISQDEPTNAVIQERMEADHPAEAAQVDWSTFRWMSAYGYTAIVLGGTPTSQGKAVCEGIAEVLDAYGADDVIEVVAGPGEAPLARRGVSDDACVGTGGTG